ncbi:hypothetical protein BKA70DRAFT_1334748 [Coprinopsis sp. MPI-PUGE-AT-0042]|nr:hypothetical protein BKA70DRAFT_1334748 [Coprinopsis sp. MPI-PUGE-AT-0042]
MSRNNHISCLPPELLVYIFKKALPVPLLKEGRLHFQAIRSVCSHWRLLSFSSPALWSSLSLTCSGGNLYPSPADSAEKWLAHAGPSIPLDLHLVNASRGTDSGLCKNDCEALESLIARHRPRWRSLCIIGAEPAFWNIFQQAPPSDWANLRKITTSTLHLRNGAGVKGIETIRRMSSIQSTPLQHLHLHIDAANSTATDFNFISAYTHLRRLSITKHSPSKIPRVTNTLPQLEVLCIVTRDLNLLSDLHTPALCELEIQLLYGGRGNQDGILRDFLTRCPNLLSVGLRGNREPMIWMAPTLSARPTITSVVIEPWPSIPLDDETWCPNLRDLTVVVHPKISILEDEDELGLMRSIASLLQRRNQRGRTGLDRLVFKCLYRAKNLPCEIFETLDIGKVDIMVPW